MNTKKYLYAAVGAQVAVAKSAQSMIEKLVSKVNENATSRSSDLKGRIDVWAGEGEQFLGKVTDAKAIDELTSKVDFDQVQTRSTSCATSSRTSWPRGEANFRPESKQAEKVTGGSYRRPAGPGEARSQAGCQEPGKDDRRQEAGRQDRYSQDPAAEEAWPAKKPAAKTTTAKASRQEGFLTSKVPTDSQRGPRLQLMPGPLRVPLGSARDDRLHVGGSLDPRRHHRLRGQTAGRAASPRSPRSSLRAGSAGLRLRRAFTVSTPTIFSRSAYSAPTPLIRIRSARLTQSSSLSGSRSAALASATPRPRLVLA
jgi:hypothetical protein